MKRFLTSLFITVIFMLFSLFVLKTSENNEVLEIYSPVKFAVDLNNNRQIDSDEIICLPKLETFYSELNNELNKEYANKNKISEADVIGLGYLAKEYAINTLQNKKVKLNYTGEISSDCKYADIYINNIDYSKILSENGFATYKGEILNVDKYNQNLSNSRKLNLVIYNHHSKKFHKPDCKYGRLSHDMVLIPLKHLPKDSIPCKYCHEIKEKLAKKANITVDNSPSPQLVHSQGGIRLYYTDFTKHLKPDNLCLTSECGALVNLIDQNKKSVDIAIYGYGNIPAITNALANAKKRGVKIRFVYDENPNSLVHFYKDNDVIKNISNVFSSDIKSKESGKIMHNKFVIFDSKIVYTGSMNFSTTGFSGYDENNTIIINSDKIAGLYEKEFKQMINGKFHNQKEKLNLPNIFSIGNSVVEVYFSPKDNPSLRITDLLKNSKKYVYIPAFLITHTGITNELINAKKRGVDVKIILDANSTSTRNSKYKILRASGIPLKFENYAGKLHSKTMIIDDEYLVLGSMNFSNSGSNKNDENTIILKNIEFAKEYKQFFIYLWNKIPDKYLKMYVKPESLESIGSCSDGIDNNFNGKIDRSEESCNAK